MELKTYLMKKEFCIMLNIPMAQIERRKDELLEWLKNFFDYELLEGKPMRIKIKEIYGDYQPLPRKKYGGEEYTRQQLQKQEDYTVFTIASLGAEFKPNSKAKIARDAIGSFGYEKYSHTNQEWVSKKFIREPFEKYGETNDRWVWVDYSTYEPLGDEILSRWKSILSEEQMDEEHRANAFDKMMQGEDISKEKAYYKKALDRFKEEFGYIPVHVREWRNK